MDEGAVGLIVLVGIAVVVSLVGHARSATYFMTSLVSALISITMFLAIAIVRDGVDPFIALAAVIGGMYCFGIALVVGLPFWFFRQRR